MAARPRWTPAKLHRALARAYGRHPAWWPVDASYHARRGTDARFEIIAGAILTQNTAWTNVEKALREMKKRGLLDPRALLAADLETLEEAVRSSGFYRQKARRLRAVAEYFRGHGDFDFDAYQRAALTAPLKAREEMLGLEGVGPETADAILLYAFRVPVFVVDAYTKRLLQRLGVKVRPRYEETQEWFTKGMPAVAAKYGETHALIVEHAKARCRSEPRCAGCPLLAACPTGQGRAAAQPLVA